MSVVTAVRTSDWDKKDGTPIVKVTNVTLDDGTETPGYDLPEVPEVGKPLPSGWEVATGKSGKPYIKVPKKGGSGFGGGQAAFRNTKEGQAIEQRSIHASVALEYAVASWGDPVKSEQNAKAVLETADQFFAWLRKNSDSSEPDRTRSGTGKAAEGPGEVPVPARSGTSPQSSDWGASPSPTEVQWERLIAVCGGSKVEALKRFNDVNDLNYSLQKAREAATAEELSAAISGVRA